jgi:hypothetical protein
MSNICDSNITQSCEISPKLPTIGATIVSDGTSILNEKNTELSSKPYLNYWSSVAYMFNNDNITKDNNVVIPGVSILGMRGIYPNRRFLNTAVSGDLNRSYKAVQNLIRSRTDKLNKLISENRLLPVESQAVDEKGNPIGGVVTRYLEVKDPIDYSTIQNASESDQIEILDGIMETATPVLGVFEDQEQLDLNGITDDDLKNYSEIMKRVNQLNDPALVSSFYTSEERLIKIGLEKEDVNFTRILQRLRNGSSTEEDLEKIVQPTFASQLQAVQNKLNQSINKLPDKKREEYLNEAISSFLSSPSVIGGVVEGTGLVIGTQLDKHLIRQFAEADAFDKIINSRAVKNGLAKVLTNPNTGQPYQTIREYRNVTGATSRQQALRNFRSITQSDEVLKRLEKTVHQNGMHDKAHHVLGKVVPAVVGTIYGCQAIYYGYNAISYGDTPTGDKYARKSLKYSALTALELLTFFGGISAGVGLLLAGAIYFTNELILEPYGKKKSDEELAKKRRAAAYKMRLVPSAFEKGIVITLNEVLSALSQADDDPSNDLTIHRYPIKPDQPTIRYTTVSVKRPRIVEYGKGDVLTTVDIEKVSVSVPIIPINLVDVNGSRVINSRGEFDQSEKTNTLQKSYRCKCCLGGCDGDKNLTYRDSTNTDTINVSPQCAVILASIAYDALSAKARIQNPQISEKDIDEYINSQGNLWNIGYSKLCGNPLAQDVCFTEDTMVLTPNGEISIKELNINDKVIAFDENGTLIESFVTETFKHISDDVYLYKFDNGQEIKSTKNHPFYTKDGFIEIGLLKIGDSVIDLYGNELLLIEYSKIDDYNVYNIEVDTYHTYIANGIRVHNKFKPVDAVYAAIVKQFMFSPPQPDPRHNITSYWPTPPLAEVYDSDPSRWDFTSMCRREEEYGPVTGRTSTLASPLVPGPRRARNRWVCNVIPFKTFMPTINEGPFGDMYGFGGSDAFNDVAIPIPPLREESSLEAPPYVANASPSDPYFPWQESNIDQYLKSFPFFLNENEISLVKSCDYDGVKKYFDNKDQNDKNNLKSYQLTLISNRYCELKNRDKRNIDSRKKYFDCVTPKILR